MSDIEFIQNLQKFVLLFGFLVGLAIIVGAIALCIIASHTASIRSDLLAMRVLNEMDSERNRLKKT